MNNKESSNKFNRIIEKIIPDRRKYLLCKSEKDEKIKINSKKFLMLIYIIFNKDLES